MARYGILRRQHEGESHRNTAAAAHSQRRQDAFWDRTAMNAVCHWAGEDRERSQHGREAKG
jgi:hypothetical protein